MGQVVNIPNVGPIEFPDGMSNAEILRIIDNEIIPSQQKGLYSATPSTPQPEEDTTLIGDLASGVATGFTTMVPLAVEGAGALAYSAGLTDDLDNAFVRWGRQSQKDLREFFGGESSSHAYGVGNALGSFASFFVPGLGAVGLTAKGAGLAARGSTAAARNYLRAAKATKVGGTGTLAVGAGAGEQAERILDLVDKLEGEYPAATENLKAAIATGGVIGLTELAPVKFVTATISKGIPSKVGKETTNKILARVAEIVSGTAPRRIAATGVGEGTQEALAGYLQDLTERGLYNPDLEIGQSAAADFGYGGSAGAIFQTGIELMLGRRNRTTPPPTNQEQAEKEQLEREAAAAFNEGADAPTEPLGLPAPEPQLLLPDLTDRETVLVPPDVNIAGLVDQTISEIGADLPLSFNNGSVVVTDEAGTPDSYDVIQNDEGIFVASKQGTRVSPNFSSLEQASEFRDGLNVSVNEMLVQQDELETNRQAQEAVQRAKLEETAATLDAARATVSAPAIELSSLPGDVAQTVNARRSQTGRNTLGAQDTVSIEELSDNNVSQDVIDGLLPVTEPATADDVRSAAAAKNILVEDAGFERFARRSAGAANIDTMSPTQLGYMIDAIEGLPALPGETAQPLPVIRPPEFTGPQYAATINLAKRKGEEGILKSEVSKNIDMKRGAPTESLIQAGVDRGDLVPHPTRKNRWVSRQLYEERLNQPRSPLERGEQIEAEARAAEERAAQEEQRRQPTRETLGPGIIVETTREEGDTRSIPERSREFQERLGETTPTPEALSRRDEIQQSLTDELNRFAASPAGRAAKLDASKIGVEIVDSVTTEAGTRAEGQLLADADSGKVIIQLALDTAQEGAATDAQVKNNLKDVFNHEVVHALKALGVINEADMASLVKYSKNARIKGSKKTIYQEIVKDYTEARVGRQLSKEELEEEAVADAFRYWAAGQLKVTGKPKSIFDRIVRFFRSIGSGLSNAEITSAEQIFNNLRAPIGARSAPVAAENREAARRAEAAAAAEGMDVPDAPIDAYEGKYSLYPKQLDDLAAKLLGVEGVVEQYGERQVIRKARISDLPEIVKKKIRGDRGLTDAEVEAIKRQKAVIGGKYSLARKPIDPKDPAFTSRDERHDNLEVAGKRLPPRGKARRLSALDLLYNDNLLPRTGSSTGYVARLLQERARKVLGGKPIAIESDTSKDGLLSDVFAAEAIAALEETGNAATWYSEKVTEAIEVASQLYPEIATDADARFAFLAALSVTSQNTPVMENSVYTSEVYEYFRENQRFPEDFSKGKHGKSMATNFALLNDLLDTMGPQGVRAFFDDQFTVKQLKEDGFNPPSGENVDTVVYGSFLLGPKIGQGFYQNLNGNFSPVTIDMWLMRTVGRATGRLIGKPEIVEKQADRLLKGLNADPEKSRNNFLIASIRDAQIDGDVDALVEIANELRLEHDRLFQTPEVQALFRQKKYNKPEWAKAAEAIITQQNKPQDSPSGGNFRNAVRRIMDKTRKKVADSGYDVTNADLQAILWYPEKNLYKKLGVRTKENLNIDYAQAFERILEGKVELDAEGNVLPPVGRGVGTETADVTGRAEEDGGEISQENVEEEIRNYPNGAKFSLARGHTPTPINQPEYVAAAGALTNPVNDRPLGPVYRPVPSGSVPRNKQTVYRLMHVQANRPGLLLPLFAKPQGQFQGWTANQWYLAEDQRPSLGGRSLALRPGIHAVGLPVFDQGKAFSRSQKRVWVEVEVPAFSAKAQRESDNSPLYPNGDRQGITERLIGPRETYSYQTNPNASGQAGTFPISGSARFSRIVPDSEIAQILRDNNLDNQIENSTSRIDDAEAQRLNEQLNEVAGAVNSDIKKLATDMNAMVLPPKFSLSRETPEKTLLNFIKQNPEGFTVTIDGQPAPPGYVVAPVKAAEITVRAEELDADSVREYAEILKDVADSTNRETYAGGWLNSEDGLYYLDAVHIYDELDTALYIADSAEQLAIFDLRTFDEIRTPEGIEQLKSAGTYSDQARNERGRDSDEAARKYAKIRAARGPKFSLSREQLADRESFNRYNDQYSVPLDAYEASNLSTLTSPSPHSENGAHRMVYDGKALNVFVPKGFDKFSRTRDKTFGFGRRHMKKHDVEAAKRTGGTYNNIAEVAAAALNSYWPLRNNLVGSPFKVTEQRGATGAPQIRMEWTNESSGYPAVLIFEPFYLSTVAPDIVRRNPALANQQVMYLQNGYVGASDGKSSSPVPQPAITPKRRTPETERSIQTAMATVVSPQKTAQLKREVLTLQRKYSLKRSEENLSPDAKKIYQDRISVPEDQTFFQRIMASFDMTDPSKRSVMLKIRRSIADNYAGVREMGKRAQEVADINAEAQVNSAIGQLERKRGIVAAGLNVGPLVRFGGQVTAINGNIVENLENDQARAKYQAAFDRLQQDTQYIETDPVTGEQTVVRYESPADLKGLAEIFNEIEQEGLWAGFNLYAAAKRANRLMAEGREKTFTQEEINVALEEGAKNPAIIRAYRNYQLWNNAFVGVMENSGVISGEAAQLWKDNSDYLPFYRQAFENEGAIYDIPTAEETATGDIIFTPDGASPNNSVLQNIYNIKAPKELKGGKPFYFVMVNNVSDSKSYASADEAAQRLRELRKLNPNASVKMAKSNQRIDNPINNILRNFDAGVTSVLTNVVASRAVRDLQRLGLAQRISTPNRMEPSPDIVGIRVGGETKYYRVQDELLLATLGATGDFQMPGLDLMAAPANLLRELITRDPGFMAANMLRDSLSAWTTSGVTKIPGPGTFAGFVKTITKDPSAEALEAAGVVGGYDAKQDKEAVKLFKKINRVQARGGLNPVTWWEKWDKLSLASDTATRVAVYNQILKDTGGNVAAANTEALDVINFSRKGSSHGIRFFSAVVPFLNARIQGLDVLYRSSTRGGVGTTSSMTKAQRMRRFYMRALAIVAMSTAYAMASMDDEDNEWYKNATEVDKDNYWIIPPTWVGLDTTSDTPAIKIPIPFEVGVLFKVIPERIVRTVREDTGMAGNLGAAQRHIMGTFAINPVPQFMLPIAETIANYDSFTGRPVVTYWDDRTEAWLANPDFVSPLAIETSKGISDTFNIRVPAQKIDHLIRGYTGTLGGYALMAADASMRSASGMPERPTRRLDQYPVLSRFLQEAQGTGPVQSFYDIYNELTNFTNTISKLEKQGRLTEIDEYVAKRQNVSLEADYIKSLAQSLKELRAFRDQVSFDPSMGSDDKAKYLQEIQKQMNLIVSEINKDKERIIRRTD